MSRHEPEGRRAVSLRCRAWTCPDCAPNRKKQLVAEAVGGSPTIFLTLTFRRGQAKDPDTAAWMLSRAWRLCRLRIMRRYRWKRLPFLAVVERHKSGWPHLHICLRSSFIDRGFISDTMADLCDSPVVDIRKIDHRGRIAGYVAKYIGKDPHRYRRTKRYWQSQDYDLRPEPEPKPKPLPGFGWEREEMTLIAWTAIWRSIGWSIVMPDAHCAIARPPPQPFPQPRNSGIASTAPAVQ